MGVGQEGGSRGLSEGARSGSRGCWGLSEGSWWIQVCGGGPEGWVKGVGAVQVKQLLGPVFFLLGGGQGCVRELLILFFSWFRHMCSIQLHILNIYMEVWLHFSWAGYQPVHTKRRNQWKGAAFLSKTTVPQMWHTVTSAGIVPTSRYMLSQSLWTHLSSLRVARMQKIFHEISKMFNCAQTQVLMLKKYACRTPPRSPHVHTPKIIPFAFHSNASFLFIRSYSPKMWQFPVIPDAFFMKMSENIGTSTT